jgi:tetratricopeptide (TPR) repeat protein
MLAEKKIANAVKLLIVNQEVVFPLNVLGLIGIDFYLKFMYGGKNLDAEVVRKYEEKLIEASKVHPNYADVWNNLGIVHLIQCRNLFLQALTEFDKALEINPSFGKAMKNKKLVENDGKEFLILLRAILK